MVCGPGRFTRARHLVAALAISENYNLFYLLRKLLFWFYYEKLGNRKKLCLDDQALGLVVIYITGKKLTAWFGLQNQMVPTYSEMPQNHITFTIYLLCSLKRFHTNNMRPFPFILFFREKENIKISFICVVVAWYFDKQ